MARRRDRRDLDHGRRELRWSMAGRGSIATQTRGWPRTLMDNLCEAHGQLGRHAKTCISRFEHHVETGSEAEQWLSIWKNCSGSWRRGQGRHLEVKDTGERRQTSLELPCHTGDRTEGEGTEVRAPQGHGTELGKPMEMCDWTLRVELV